MYQSLVHWDAPKIIFDKEDRVHRDDRRRVNLCWKLLRESEGDGWSDIILSDEVTHAGEHPVGAMSQHAGM